MRTFLIVAAILPAIALGACQKKGEADPKAVAAAAATPAPPGGWVAQVAKVDDGGVRVGNPNAPVKLVEFGSRTCPACGAFARQGFQPLIRDYVSTGKVSFEFHDFLIHAPDLANVLIARCGPTASFLPMLEQMYADQPAVLAKLEQLPAGFQQSLQGKSPAEQARAWAELLGYTSFAAQRGLPRARTAACLSDSAEIDRIGREMQQVTAKYSIDHTPTFIINGVNQGDTSSWPGLKSRLDAALGA